MDSNNIYTQLDRSEEVQHIIDKMPTKFGLSVTSIVIFIFILLFVFGWLIRYPAVITGQININTPSAPIKLIANSNGKLKFNHIKSMDMVSDQQIIAYIENSATPENVMFIDSLLKTFDPNKTHIEDIRKKIPANFSVGELNGKFSAFINSLQELINYKEDRLLYKQGINYSQLLKQQNDAIKTMMQRVYMAKKNVILTHKFYKRDSTLLAKKVISESEFDKTEMSFLASKDATQNSINNENNARQAAQQTITKLQELRIQNPEKEKELKMSLISAINDLADNIKIWKQKYVFFSPYAGKVQFLKFYSENHFVQNGEQVFTIIPNDQKIIGEVILPTNGSGKIKTGQEVIVKLDNYPFNEFGSITGSVQSISLTSTISKSKDNDIDTYMVIVNFPNQLKTNYGTKLAFKAEAKGTAEIITTDRRLLERLFDNLKYIVTK